MTTGKTQAESSAFRQNTWKRLCRNKGAVFGMVVIAMAILLAISAYFIAPDPSPDANRMIVEIGGRKPGYTQEFLLVKKEREVRQTPFFSRLFFGREDLYEYIPITWFEKKGDSLVFNKYIDEGVGERRALALEK